MRVRILKSHYYTDEDNLSLVGVEFEALQDIRGVTITGHALHAIAPISFEDDSYEYFFSDDTIEVLS